MNGEQQVGTLTGPSPRAVNGAGRVERGEVHLQAASGSSGIRSAAMHVTLLTVVLPEASVNGLVEWWRLIEAPSAAVVCWFACESESWSVG